MFTVAQQCYSIHSNRKAATDNDLICHNGLDLV
jgi:hypothetical protein